MNGLDSWVPIKFEPDDEQSYARHMLERSIPLGRLGLAIGAASFVGYQFWGLMLEPAALAKTGYIRLAIVFYMTGCIGLSYFTVIRTSAVYWSFVLLTAYLVVGGGFTFILSQLPGGFVAGVGGLILGMIFLPVVANGVLQAMMLLVPYLFVCLFLMYLLGADQFELINTFSWVGGGVSFALGFAYILEVINRRAYQLELQLDEEKQRSDALLLNILPAEIATRLKAREEPLADNHESVSVLFADLAGFTNISRKMSANELVTLLNDLFSRFDMLVEKHGAEKIKTIGDAYMVATGLSDSVGDHAENIAELALEMRNAFFDFREQNKVDLKLRIGLHSGSVVAGVIGKQKFAYDLWGNTVNIASRMESEGLPDQIQISTETQNMLSSRFQTSLRGEIKIKGHRSRTTYLLEGLN